MKLHGIKIPHLKNTADTVPIHIPVPKTVTIPMSMHIGKPAEILVKRGDNVKVGQLIGKADGNISAHIHSSVSGTVQKIDQMIASNGAKITCAVIDTDGKQELSETIKPPPVNDFDSFISAVKESGAVGLGGAGFPSFAKLNVNDLSKIQAVVINAAECEPYITSDTRTMLDKTQYISKGISAIKKYMNVKKFIIGIETNKPAAIAKMRELAKNDNSIEVMVLPSMYPQGGEKVLVFNTMKKIIPKGRLPIDVGAVVINITTLAFIGEYPDPDEVLEILEPLEFAPFQITMDKVGCFDDLWWTGFAKSKELENLAGQVRHLLSDADIPYDKKKFRPHVTLLRNARYYSGKPPYLEIRPVSMMVDHFCLMRSTRGKHGMIYTELGSVAASQSK